MRDGGGIASPHKLMNQDDFLQLSGIQHFAFCKRQWGLIHIEGLWEDNDLTASGNIVHRNVDEGLPKETRRNLRILRSVRVASCELGLSGICDTVEILRLDDGNLNVFPVEYKHGVPKTGDCDRVQLCAQAMALGEMFGEDVSCGAIYYHTIRRRGEVQISDSLKDLTRALALEMHNLFSKGETPASKYGPHCMSCSLYDKCLPKTEFEDSSVEKYMRTKRALIE